MNIVQQIQDDIDAFCKTKFYDDPRKHLGASIIGNECQAYAWNTFRWLRFEDFTGRMLRLFNRGHTEEPRFVTWLQGIGFEVLEINPETGKQFRLSGSKNHFGGSLDGICKPPASYGLPANTVWLVEFKTHNEKNFNNLVKDGVKRSKPMHFKQMSAYGRAYNLTHGLYCAVNKNDDTLHFELVELDWLLADDMYRKADNIIFARKQPIKISNTPVFFDCKYCHFSGICHKGEVPTKNCRSCRFAVPIEEGQWKCEIRSDTIPENVIPIGCSYYDRII